MTFAARLFSVALRCAVVAVGAVVAALVALTPVSAAAATLPRAALAQYSCVHALNPQDRAVAVQAVMRPLPGTRKLAIKFDLLQRSPDASAATVLQAGDLGVWKSPPTPTLGQLPGDVWRLSKSVLDLDAPDTYQFRISYRWTGAHNKVLGTAVRWSQTCHQKELRPDLLVSSIAVAAIAGQPNQELYTATIVNQGATGTGPFEVLFVPGDGSAAMTRSLVTLAAGESRQLSFAGPVCDPSSPPSVTADATAETDDYDRTNNALAATCPATTASPSTTQARRRRAAGAPGTAH